MKSISIRTFSGGHLLIAVTILFGMNMLKMDIASATHISEVEIERYVRARIDIGESMGNFFRNRRPPQFGPEGGPSMEELRKLEEEINNQISEILSKYDLTIDEYQSRSPDVFEEEEGIQQFLSAHPDLKKRYESLPLSPRRGRRSR